MANVPNIWHLAFGTFATPAVDALIRLRSKYKLPLDEYFVDFFWICLYNNFFFFERPTKLHSFIEEESNNKASQAGGGDSSNHTTSSSNTLA